MLLQEDRVELLPTKGEENEEKSNERESGKDRAECFDKPATQQLSEGRDFPGVEQKRRGQSQRKPSNESSDADVEPFQGPLLRSRSSSGYRVRQDYGDCHNERDFQLERKFRYSAPAPGSGCRGLYRTGRCG